MANLGGRFDATSQANNPSSVLPAGDYPLVMVKSEKKETKARDGEYLNCEFKVLNGQHQGRTVFHMFNMWLASEKANEIGRGQFSQLCKAVGVETPDDSEQLHNIPFIAKIAVHSDNYGEKNKITKFLELGKSTPSLPKPPAVTPATVAAASTVDESAYDDIPF